ncbi:MAG: glycosyltransferase [Rhodospirillales bacterium]
MFTLWRGESGRTYEFAVLNPDRLLITAPVVFVLVRQRNGQADALFVGQAERLGGDDGLDATWIAARELGMTHVHASFDTLWPAARSTQVVDLVAALSPPLNASAAGMVERPPSAAQVIRIPDRPEGTDTDGRGGLADAAIPAVLTPSADPLGHGASEPIALWPSPPSPRRGAAPSERLRAMVRAAARAIERLVSGNRHAPDASSPQSPQSFVAPAPAAAVRVAPVPSMDERQAEARNTGTSPATVSESPPAPAARLDHPESIESVRGRLHLPPAAPVILFAGHMAESSGIDILMEAIITVAAADPDAYFVLAGSGSLADAAKARAAAVHLGSRCRFTGDLEADACHDYLEAADCVVVPAHAPATDGFADAAIAAGKPILTTHQAQLPAVHHGVNGLVAYDNPNSLVWGLRELLSMRAEHRMLFEAPRRVA